ncbi:MAG TPA: type II toxin-antitoxin system HicB family antitoxin [Kiritimatiellia bacterium]|jgi:predicted HicB family RNase H-like nuclease|nr:type II toxin-antitoxin system HicB family antitoxin [Lentisphaerota bacterium]HPC18875.1 type II toxin-antitoxin system HicB family antitoxin [Kiritimatiellia bacterium]
MKKYFEFKGYLGSLETSIEDKCLYGRIEFINDLVTYHGNTIEELEAAFKEAVDDYLATCTAQSKEPDRPFSGSFNIRIGSDLHKKVAIAAKQADRSLNDFIKQSLEQCIERPSHTIVQHFDVHYAAEQTKPYIFSAAKAYAGEPRW